MICRTNTGLVLESNYYYWFYNVDSINGKKDTQSRILYFEDGVIKKLDIWSVSFRKDGYFYISVFRNDGRDEKKSFTASCGFDETPYSIIEHKRNRDLWISIEEEEEW